MKQLVLHDKHLQSKAVMTDFQGWQVPQSYSDPQEEYYAVRHTAGLFDISYLGRIEIAGPKAGLFLQKLFSRNIDRMAQRTVHYGFFCNEQGGVLDDSVLYRLSEDRFLLSINAINTGKILAWLRKHETGDERISDVTETTAQFSLQGPVSATLLENMLKPHFRKLRLHAAREVPLLDMTVLISRTGYSGEHGYEFFTAAEKSERLWDAIMNAGRDAGLLECGLASRDILRIEMGHLLYGIDIDEERTPVEACKDRFVDLKKEFVGKDALLGLKAGGTKQKLAGFILIDKSLPRSGGSIFSENREIGAVTSGTVSPSLRKGIGLGYVANRYAQPGQEIEIEIRDREIAARIVDLPFIRKK